MPDDYYVSQYSGEEIDERLTAAHNAVRYDAAQSLTDAQKQQARGNIAAAPDGFGLGSIEPSVEYRNTNGDNITATGWYVILPEVAGFDLGYSLLRHESHGLGHYVQTLYLLANTTGFGKNVALHRVKENNQWYPWEWVNPPLKLGVEYRTTERFLGKPVYVKAINFGAVAIGMNQVSFMSDVDRPIRCYAMLTDRNTTIPWIGTPGTDQSFCSINFADARIQSTVAFPDGAVVFVGYYYKTNE